MAYLKGSYLSGSTQFSGSLAEITVVTGSSFTGSFTGSFLGDLEGTASFVISASHAITASYVDNRYEESITGNSSYTITHNLNEDYPIVQIYDTNKEQVLPATISASNANAVFVEFASNFDGRVIVKK
jgi:hypothetical protein